MHDNLPRMTHVKQKTEKILNGRANEMARWELGIAISSWRMTILGGKEETTEYPTVMICY